MSHHAPRLLIGKPVPPGTTVLQATLTNIRVPTSDHLLGSDPLHKKPNYSALLLAFETDSDLTGIALTCTIGAGDDGIGYGVQDLAQLVVGLCLDEFVADPGGIYRRLVEHHKVRWLADGIFRMAAGNLLNALWDLWAKVEQKPLWKLLTDLPPEKIVQSIDWRYLVDALTQDEALRKYSRMAG